MTRGRHYRLGRGLGIPPVWAAEVTVRCPDGWKHVRLVGPTSALAVRKAGKFRPPGRCYTESVKIVPRGRAAGLSGARPRRLRSSL